MDKLMELLALDKPFLTPADVAGVIGADPQTIRVTARQRPDLLGFPVIVCGNRTRIPRIPFLRYLGILDGKEETYEERQVPQAEPAEAEPPEPGPPEPGPHPCAGTEA